MHRYYIPTPLYGLYNYGPFITLICRPTLLLVILPVEGHDVIYVVERRGYGGIILGNQEFEIIQVHVEKICK